MCSNKVYCHLQYVFDHVVVIGDCIVTDEVLIEVVVQREVVSVVEDRCFEKQPYTSAIRGIKAANGR